MICHGVVYSRMCSASRRCPDESIREILPYGACNPGNDAFPKELLTAQVVLTCTPFDPNNHTEKMNAAFLENQEKYAPFELAATFDMGNGYTITAYRRVKAPIGGRARHLPRLSGRGERAVPLQFQCCLGRAGRAIRK